MTSEHAPSPARVPLPSPAEVIASLHARSWLPGLICPDYDGYCITNVAPLIPENFGLPAAVPPALAALRGGRFRHVLLLIVDAFGYRLMERCAEYTPTLARLLERGAHAPVTVTFPSTTTVRC